MVSKSFTLIELIITASVIAILTAFSVPAIARFQQYADLKMTAQEIRTAILEAKNYSLAPRASGTTNIQSYKIVFYGNGYSDQNKKNSYELYETDTAGNNTLIPNSLRKLPKDIIFESFNWNSNSAEKGEIAFSVEKQGAISNNFSAGVSIAQVKVKRKSTNQIFVVEIIKATGAIDVKES